uniref:Uncharacterized protein n=1 Tax=viral metagenome TaxID=1070528 RepID=A0A6M3IT39_9ZZZZ
MEKVQTTPVAAELGKKYQIFGSLDLNDKGKVHSTYPSWYFSHMTENLRDEIQRSEYQLDNDLIPRSEVAITKERLAQKKKQLKELDNAIPDIVGKDRDKVANVRDVLGASLADAMFSRDQMKKGLADAATEMKRKTEPCIKLPSEVRQFAEACNVKITKGMATRDGAAKAWKIASRLLGEPSNTEVLRKD